MFGVWILTEKNRVTKERKDYHFRAGAGRVSIEK